MYIVGFMLTIFFTYLAEKNFKEDNKKTGIFFSIITILIPTLMAAFRSKNIGTDVSVYVEPYFNKALKYNNFSAFAETIDSDYLFLLVIYLISRVTENLQFVFFAIELIIMIFIYLGIYNFRHKASMPLMMLFFLTFYYNRTYNLSRQSIAIAIIFFGFKYILNRNFFKYLICVIFAFGFHYSAIFMCTLYVLYNINNIKGNFIIKIAIIAAIVVIFSNFQNIFKSLIEINILPAKYLRYIESDKGSFNNTETLYRLINIILISITIKSFNKLDKNNRFLFFIMILDIMIYQLGILSDFTQRISLYLGINVIYIMPQLVNAVKQNKENRQICTGILVSIQVIYWMWNFMYLNTGKTFPYEFFK